MLKKPMIYRSVFLVCIVILVISFNGINLKWNKKTPQDVLTDKYSNNAGYNILLHRENNEYIAYLGSDNENIYFDIFENQNYLGGSFIPLSNDIPISLYQTRQSQNVIVVFGDNTKTKYGSYTLTAIGNKTEPKIINQTIREDNKLLDIYILDKKYNIDFDLKFNK